MERAGSLERIVLPPPAKDTSNSNPEQPIADKRKDSESKHARNLELRFLLERYASIKEVEDFARGLNSLCRQKGGLPVSRVIWGGLPPSQISSITNHKLFAESRRGNWISPWTHRLDIEAAMEFKKLSDRNRTEKEKTPGQIAEGLAAAKIIDQNRHRIGAEHKLLLRSIIFRSFVTLLLYLFSRYCSGSPLLCIGAFYISFLVMLINVSIAIFILHQAGD